MPLWDGRFGGGPGADMVAFSSSLGVDLRMAREDVAGSVAHARMLGAVGLLTADEVERLVDGLGRVLGELESGAYLPGPELEDVHLAVESRLTALVGEVGKKLHTARSRNDQVATDVRLWLKSRVPLVRDGLRALIAALCDRVRSDGDALIPGYTHLQRGQPILLGHHLLAHAWAARRDCERLDDALRRQDRCPLGAGAMAGTPHPIDRAMTAAALGFAGPVDNAMDAVSARDHVLEVASACAIAMVNLSRLAEELVVWSSAEFRFVRLSDAYATGSSIMPQKRNPDAAELVRGKSGRVVGDLVALLTLVKGLPLAYDRDLQEDREALFDAVETTAASAGILAGCVATMAIDRDRFEAELAHDFLLATELADHLVTRGVPFRDAHHAAGRIVADCEARGTDLRGLTVASLRAFHPAFGDDALGWLDPRRAAERRTSTGGTAPTEIARQVEALASWLGAGVASTGVNA
ncbi:MAG: argininosuccinate lyase [Myxococcota bacterium]